MDILYTSSIGTPTEVLAELQTAINIAEITEDKPKPKDRVKDAIRELKNHNYKWGGRV